MGPKARSATKRNFELNYAFHLGADQGFDFGGFIGGNFEEQFVVDLQDHARFELALGELAVDGDHGQLDEVGGGALQRRVDGGALGEAALIGIAALDVGNGTDAAEERAHDARLARGFQSLFDERFHAGVAREVAVDVGARFGLRNAQLRGQAEGRDAVDDAEVDGLGAVAGLLVHSGGGYAEDFAGGEGVNVFVVLVGVESGAGRR